MTVTEANKADNVNEILAHACGADYMCRHPFGGQFSSGVEAVAAAADCFWLLDVVFSHQPRIKKEHPELWDFQVWKLSYNPGVEGGISEYWVVEAWSDTPDDEESTLLSKQVLEYTDFPKELMPFEELWLEGGTLILKGEH